jgi:hypothetical protein
VQTTTVSVADCDVSAAHLRNSCDVTFAIAYYVSPAGNSYRRLLDDLSRLHRGLLAADDEPIF